MEENREQIEKTCCCQCSERKKERSEKEYKDLINRLSRIEGQVRGVKGCLLCRYSGTGFGDQFCTQQFQ